jgi:hypothetical protein
MKKVTGIFVMLFIATGMFAQTDTSTSGHTQSRTSEWNKNRSGWQDTSGIYRWQDSGYFRRNRSTFDSSIHLQRKQWNQADSYFLGGNGDTIRPYDEQRWYRDSLNFERRNWDSFPLWQNDYQWGDTTGMPGNSNSDTGYENRNNSRSNNMSGTNTKDSAGDMQTSASMDSAKIDSGYSTTKGKKTWQKTKSGNKNNMDSTTTVSSGQANSGKPSSTKNKKDRIYLKENVLFVSKQGASSKVTKNITLKDGTIVQPDGTVKFSNGTTRKLTNGEYIPLENEDLKSSGNKK